jgi:hypothetical protein
MATATKGAEIIQTTRQELQEQLFEQFFDSVREQAEMTPEQLATLTEYVDPKSEAPAVLVKRDQLAMFIHRWQAECEYLRSQEVLLAERRRSIETFLGHFKGGMLAQFLNWGVKVVEGRLHRFSLKKNPGRVVITDETLLPTEFVNYVATPNKTAIREALDAGREVPGAVFEDGNMRLEIK